MSPADAFEAGGWEEVPVGEPRPPGAPRGRPPRVVNVKSLRVSRPAGLVMVTRATPWGNPWRVRASDPDSRRRAILRHRESVARRIRLEEGYLVGLRRDLGGRDLGCVCSGPCHARTLLAAANSRAGGVLE